MLPVVWTAFALSAVAGFIVIAAYWLDVQDRADLSARARIGWSAATLAFPVSIPVYAFAGGPGWPLTLRVASFVPALGVLLFLGLASGVLG